MRASAGSKVGAAIATVAAVDLRPRLARLDVPVSFLWGDRDRVFPLAILPGLRASRTRAPRSSPGPGTCRRSTGRPTSSRPWSG